MQKVNEKPLLQKIFTVQISHLIQTSDHRMTERVQQATSAVTGPADIIILSLLPDEKCLLSSWKRWCKVMHLSCSQGSRETEQCTRWLVL